ncbi:MAG: autotransporter assembly complex family protein [Pseudomonadota bacterium]
MASLRTAWLALLLATMLGACSSDPETDILSFERSSTAIDYEVEISGLPSEELQAKAEDTLALFRRQEDGAESLAFLKRRASSDADLIKRLLRSEGYYAGEVEIDVTDAQGKDTPARVEMSVSPGKAFTLLRHDFVLASGAATEPDAAALGSPVGEAAAAAAIVGAERAAVEELKQSGYPYAQRGKRRAVADLEAATLEVDTPLSSGPSAVFGDVGFEGLQDVRARYLLTYLPWEPGDVLDTRKLRTFQREILATDLFNTVTVVIPETSDETEGPVALPVTVTAEERPFRTVSFGARYSTDNGPSVSAGFEHRNLFGENEIIEADADIGLELQRLAIGYREPQYLRPGQDLLAGLVLKREEDDAFDDLSATGTVGLQRRLNERWVVGAGLLGEASLITDQGVETTAFLAGIPVFAEYDDSNDLLNPTEGIRFRAEATPFAGVFDDAFAGFLLVDTKASTYYDIFGDQEHVLAARGRFGTILTDELDTVPQTRRLYSGGGGSVRGYAQRFVGELDANNDPIGGLSAVEAGIELRSRIYGDLGGVVFVDAGSVSEESFPAFDNGVQVAAGLGFRYYSPAGPIRLDVAFPVNGRDADDAFQFYFSIGQAF